MRIFFYWLGKTMELVGLCLMPLALYCGFTMDGSGGMTAEMTFLVLGGVIFYVGRSIEGLGGRPG